MQLTYPTTLCNAITGECQSICCPASGYPQPIVTWKKKGNWAAERRKHMFDHASVLWTRKTLECILVLQRIFWVQVTSELRKRTPMVHKQK